MAACPLILVLSGLSQGKMPLFFAKMQVLLL